MRSFVKLFYQNIFATAGCAPRGKEYSLLMANRRLTQNLSGTSSWDDDSDDHNSFNRPSSDDNLESSEPLGGDDRDALTRQDIGSLREVLGIQLECDIKVPGPQDDCHNPPLGYFTLFLEHFTGGLLFPPQPLLVELVKSLGMSFSQLTPNAVMTYLAFSHKMRKFKCL